MKGAYYKYKDGFHTYYNTFGEPISLDKFCRDYPELAEDHITTQRFSNELKVGRAREHWILISVLIALMLSILGHIAGWWLCSHFYEDVTYQCTQKAEFVIGMKGKQYICFPPNYEGGK